MNTLKMEYGLWGEGCILCMCKDFIGLCIIIVLCRDYHFYQRSRGVKENCSFREY